MGRFIDITGRVFGRLRVIKRADNKNGKPAWLCLCSCGNEKIIAGNSLRSGLTTSCGCYRSEKVSGLKRNNRKQLKQFLRGGVKIGEIFK